MADLFDLVAEERDAVRSLLVRWLDLDDVALHAKTTTPQHRVVANVLRVDQLAQHQVAVLLLPPLEDDHPLPPLLRRAESVDAGDGRHHHDVAPGEEGGGGGKPQPRDVVVLRRVFLDVEVGLRNVGLRLVVVVVRDEVLHRVVRKELAELVAELGCQRLVVCDHERRSPDLLDRPGHRRRLARARRADQGLVAIAGLEAFGQRADGSRLVAGRAVGGGCFELGHFVQA